MSPTELPAELLLVIGEYLDVLNLRHLSLASKRWRSAVTPVLFRALVIDASHLDDSVANCSQLLQSTNCARHVRSLKITDSGDRFDDDTFANPLAIAQSQMTCQEAWKVHEQDHTWLPLVDFLQHLSALQDLIWECTQQLPPCLLRILGFSKHLSSCRLHLRTFRLQSLHESGPLDPHELAIIQSPNLYALWFHYSVYDLLDAMPEAVLRIINGLAPNLREVRLQLGPSAVQPDLEPGVNVQSLRNCTTTLSQASGALTKLQIVQDRIFEKALEKWSTCSDFASLNTLLLDSEIMPIALESLASYNFGALRTLALRLDIHKFRFDDDHQDDNSAAAGKFLISIPPLSTLRLEGRLESRSLCNAILHHGATLRKLWLMPSSSSLASATVSLDDVVAMKTHCHLIQNLRVGISRSKGDAIEVATYRALGSLPNLQTLDLVLDSSECGLLDTPDGLENQHPFETPNDPEFDEADSAYACLQYGAWKHPREGHIRRGFVNCALDKTLALSIFSLMASSKPLGALPLADVKVLSTGGAEFGDSSVIPEIVRIVTNELERSWRIVRNFDPERAGEITITELESKTALWEASGYYLESEIDPGVELIFRRIWPEMEGSSSWKEDWRSLPLSI